MTNIENREPRGSFFTEHLVFVVLLLPTFVVLAAVGVSLAGAEASMIAERPIMTAAACEPCGAPDADERP
jgi:hypothetical protein